MIDRKPFHGLKRGLVITIDLGTTYSGISYAVLDPGQVPEIRPVTRYPGQDAGDSKIPTVIYYDSKGKMLAAGAEEPGMDDEEGEQDSWPAVEPLKVEWFKLLLRPNSSTTDDTSIPTATLPPSKDVVSVFADFYRYMYDRAKAYICETNVNGDSLWNSVQGNIRFVLSHPNGWGGPQQNAMRRAAILAGLVPDTPEGRERITFVSEGEASFHYCVSKGLMSDAVEVGKNVMIVDAGGGTVDLSTYAFTQQSPIKISEIAPSDCIIQGSVIVRQRAHDYLKTKLKGSRFGQKAYLDSICEIFDQTAKKRFKGVGDSSVKFSNMINDRDPNVGIRNGQIRLTKDEVCAFFDPSIKAIIEAVEAQKKSSGSRKVSAVCLVGGFAASEYLFCELNKYLDQHDLQLFRPDEHTGKAVAEGAVSFHLDHFVSSRIAKATYGTVASILYTPYLPSHVQRRSTHGFIDLDGEFRLQRGFHPILWKGTQVSETKEFQKEFWCRARKKKDIALVEVEILCHRGDKPPPEFIDDSRVKLHTLCTISADVSHVPTTVMHGGQKGSTTYNMRYFQVVLSLGLTELKAHISWKENGVTKRGPASIVYDDDYPVTVPDL